MLRKNKMDVDQEPQAVKQVAVDVLCVRGVRGRAGVRVRRGSVPAWAPPGRLGGTPPRAPPVADK